MTARDLETLRRVAWGRVGRGLLPSDVDDLVQEAALSACNTDLPEDLKRRDALLATILVRRVVDYVRSDMRRVRWARDLADVEPFIAGPDEDPCAGIDLRRELRRIPPAQARALLLAWMGHEAGDGRISQTAHYQQVRRARVALRKAMA